MGSRITSLLVALVAVEAVGIAALVLTRPPDAHAAPSAEAAAARGTGAPGAAPPRLPTRDARPAPGAADVVRPADAPLAAPSPLVPAPVLDGAGIVLYGTVTTRDEPVLPGARVSLVMADAERSADVEQGTFAFAGLPPGTVELTCRATAFLDERVSVELDARRPVERLDIVLSTAPTVGASFRTPDGRKLLELLDLQDVPGQLRPVVTREPLSGDLPARFEQHATWERFHADEPLLGSEEFLDCELMERNAAALRDTGWDGALHLQVPLPVHVHAVWREQVLATITLAKASDGAAFTLPLEGFLHALGTVRARIVDRETRRPVPGVLVSLAQQNLDVDETGTVAFQRIAAGHHELKVHPPGAWMRLSGVTILSGPGAAEFGIVTVSIDLAAGQMLDLGELELERTFVVRGRVTDGHGLPVGTQVYARRADGPVQAPDAATAEIHAEMGEADGTFEVRLVGGRWSLDVDSTHACEPVVVEITRDVEDVRLVVRD